MSNEDDKDERPSQDSGEEQRTTAGIGQPSYDPSPQAFRAAKGEEHFEGASGVLFEQAMAQTRMAICLCDPNEDDLPIVFANRAFRELTGYEDEDIIGNNCRFLQGPDTAQEPVRKIREALAREDVVVVELLNYRKDGSSFWNALHLGPIYDTDGKLIYFFGSQWDVSDVHAARAEERQARIMARELSHRMKNMFAVISGIVNITARNAGIVEEGEQINSRIQALGRAYETTLDDASTREIEIGQAIRSVLEPYGPETGKIKLLGNGVKTSFNTVSLVGLTLHEFAANATKYGALSNEAGFVEVDWRTVTDEDGQAKLMITWNEKGGSGIVEPQSGGTGQPLVDRLIGMARGKIQRDWRDEGLHATITIASFEPQTSE